MEMAGFNKREKRELRRDLKRKREQVWDAKIWEPAMRGREAGGTDKAERKLRECKRQTTTLGFGTQSCWRRNRKGEGGAC